MTEAEWLDSTDTTPMLEFLRGRASDRKLRLFAVACSRDVWPSLVLNPDMVAAVEVAEAFADGRVGEAERRAAHAAITDVAVSHEAGLARHSNAFAVAWYASGADPLSAARYGAKAACSAVADAAFFTFPPGVGEWGTATQHSEQARQRAWEHVTRLLRDVVGNPFRPVVLDPAWRTTTVTGLAAAIYAEKAFDRMPILADALEEAGCDHPDVLAHCRSDAPHKVAEQYADGVGSSRELSAAFAAAWEVVRTSAAPKIGAGAAATACRDDDVLFDNPYWSYFVHEKWPEYFHCDLLRDIFGPLPFRPVTADPRWLTSTAVALARTVYEDRAFDRLPILADALEEAGCDEPFVLSHCRSDGPHVPGCWAVDLVLGKE